MNGRKIKPVVYVVDAKGISDLLAELKTQVETGNYKYLLAHADDGVIWGQVNANKLSLSTDAFPDVSPVLRADTLMELRLFGEKSEWHVWHGENGWQACIVTEGKGDAKSAFDEQYILWGTEAHGDAKDGFCPVRRVGFRHHPHTANKNGRSPFFENFSSSLR